VQEIVAVITAYRPQADYLQDKLAKAFDHARAASPGTWPSTDDIGKMTIGTVHRLQGAERPIVCFSLVEGPQQSSSSFIDRDPSLLNVAVSRAKKSFVIFANPHRLFPAEHLENRDFLTPIHRLGAH